MDKTDYLPLRREQKDARLDIKKCTCLKCEEQDKSPRAYDVYNYDGDCIMEK